MRRRSLVAVILVTLAGCGSSSSSSEKLTARAFGTTFTPVEVAFVGPADASCTFPDPPIAYANSAVLIGFSAKAGLCARATDPCTGQKDLTFIAGTVAHAQLQSEVAPGLQVGTYTVYADVTAALPDLNGEIRAAVLEPIRSDAACVETDGDAGTGTLTLESIETTEVRGRVDVTFPDGGFLRGPFVATPCATTFEVCSGSPRSCEGTPTCP